MKTRVAKYLIIMGILAVLTGCGKDIEDSGQIEDIEVNSLDNNKENDSEKWVVDYSDVEVAKIEAGVATHDPALIQVDGTYYIFGTHMATAKSDDTLTWEYVGNGYKPSNPVYQDLWASDSKVFEYAGNGTSIIPTDDGGNHVWAPDVIYNKKMGCYVLYYCTSSTWNASNLCYATSDNIEGPYVWQGALIYSGFTEPNIDATDVCQYVDKETALTRYIKASGEYNYDDYPNAIDPHPFYDEDGRMWLVYGSWSGGIFLIELDESTGEVIHPEENEAANVDPYFGKRLLGGGHKSIEGPYILFDENSGYYYLFVSYGELRRAGGYQIRVFRSDKVDGDYVDMNGEAPNKFDIHEKYGIKLSGNYFLPSLDKAYMATGHNSAIINDKNQYLICYHTRFDNGGENFEPRVKQFFMNKEGWPCVLPYSYQSEEISETGYTPDEVCGIYYFINPTILIDDDIATPVYMELKADGTLDGENLEGSWTYEEGSPYMTLTFNDNKKKSHTYSGVFCRQFDEAGKEVMTFTAVGNNRSAWGVKK